MRAMKKLLVTLGAVATLTAAMAGSALAAPPAGKGAEVLNVDMCTPLIGGGTICFTAKGMINEVSTPSGNTSYVTNYRETLDVLEDGEVTWSTTSKEHFHALTRDDVLLELSSRSTFTVTSYGQTTCVQYHFHGTNGTDQFVRIDFC